MNDSDYPVSQGNPYPKFSHKIKVIKTLKDFHKISTITIRISRRVGITSVHGRAAAVAHHQQPPCCSVPPLLPPLPIVTPDQSTYPKWQIHMKMAGLRRRWPSTKTRTANPPWNGPSTNWDWRIIGFSSFMLKSNTTLIRVRNFFLFLYILFVNIVCCV